MLGYYKNLKGFRLYINEDCEPDYSVVLDYLDPKRAREFKDLDDMQEKLSESEFEALCKECDEKCPELGYFGYVLEYENNGVREQIATKWSIPSLKILFDELVHKCVSKGVDFDSFFNDYPSHLESVKHELIGSYCPNFRELGATLFTDYKNSVIKCLNKDNKVIFEQSFKKEKLYFINAVLESELFKLQKEVA